MSFLQTEHLAFQPYGNSGHFTRVSLSPIFKLATLNQCIQSDQQRLEALYMDHQLDPQCQ